MPIFEFVCSQCGNPFEELVRSSSSVDEVVCPVCHSTEVRKKVSLFASKSTSGGSFAFSNASSSCSTGST